MEYVNIDFVDKPVSRLIFGTSTPLMQKGGDATALLDRAFGLGVTAFDTARCYGKAEETLGAWVRSRGNREKIVIQSKGGISGFLWRSRIRERDIRYDLDKSLAALGTDHIDIYLLHRDDKRVPAGDIVQLLNSLASDGKIRAFGGSNWTHERIEAANEYAYAHGLRPFVVSSPNYGLAVMMKDPWGGGLVTVTGGKNEAEREWYARTQMPLAAWSCIGGGLFSGRFTSKDPSAAKRCMALLYRKAFLYPQNIERLARAERLAARKNVTPVMIAVAYLLASGMNVFPIVGTTNAAHLESCVKALDIHITKEEAAWLDLRGDDPGEEG